MLCQLLLYNKVNQLNVYICPLPFEPSSHSTRLSLWLTHQESACNAGDPGSIPVSGRYLEKGMATPSTHPPSFPSRSSESSKLSPLCYTELPTSRLFHTWQCIYVNAALSICPTLSFPHYVHKSVLYFCISFLALKTGSPFFQIPYICINKEYLSDLLHSV